MSQLGEKLDDIRTLAENNRSFGYSLGLPGDPDRQPEQPGDTEPEFALVLTLEVGL